MDTIFAETTPPGRGGVSIIRISGPDARKSAEALSGPLPEARKAEFRVLMSDGEALDQALVLWFEAGASFTGEEISELHLHGAPVIVSRICAALREMGLRHAEAGEFTRRAFEKGKIDLSQAEGLADLLAAETESQRRLAMQTASGTLRRNAEAWRTSLIRAGALVEASVDFADEDLPEEVPQEVFSLLSKLRHEMSLELSGYEAAERLRTGFEVAVIGPPNSGKSSFINKLASREVALVSDLAGTTRDIIELRYDLQGLAVTFLDTAGLRETDDRVEAMGVDRARRRAEVADLRLHMSVDGTRDDSLFQPGDFIVRTKCDLSNDGSGVSVITGEGISPLLDDIFDVLSQRIAGAGLVSHARQAEALETAIDLLEVNQYLPPELIAEAIRGSSTAIDGLVGKIGADDYLDVIFSSFCVGK